MNNALSYLMQGDIKDALIFMVSGLLIAFYILPLHELAHALVAHKLGDNTAKSYGRLTLNPMKHFSPLGGLLIIFMGFGWAKPVPVNMNNFKNPKTGMALTALAGPVTNLFVGLVFAFFFNLTAYFYLTNNNIFLSVLMQIFYFTVTINVFLAIFNLIPFPPLDGSKVLAGLLPNKLYYKYMSIERYGFILLMVFVFVGAFSFISNVSDPIITLFFNITGAPFGVVYR